MYNNTRNPLKNLNKVETHFYNKLGLRSGYKSISAQSIFPSTRVCLVLKFLKFVRASFENL